MVIKPRLAALLLSLTLLSACSAPKSELTEIMLVVDSNLLVPGELDQITMRVQGPSGALKSATAELGSEQPSLPRSVGLVHEKGPLSPVNVVVEGRLGGNLVISREARLAFLKGRTLVLPMHLVRSCLALSCPEEQTCTETGCQNIDIDPLSLGSWSGKEPGLGSGAVNDGGGAQQDGAVAPSDAGDNTPDSSQPNDASMGDADAGSSDAGGVCTPQVEVCNEVDDDCNDVVDEGFDLLSDPKNCGQCAMSCGAARVCCTGICKKNC